MTTALVIGAGPAGLMAADVLATAGVKVTVCDAKPSFGRKFLMAGKSGLNLTKDEPLDTLLSRYSDGAETLRPMISDFDAQAIQDWARGLGQSVFIGSTGRVFPDEMKASPLLRAWLSRLTELGVERRTGWRWTGWRKKDAVFATETGQQVLTADAIVFALGGASWARLGADGQWAGILAAEANITPFRPSNAALQVRWTDHMASHMGSALKAVAWRAGGQISRGEASISARGLEGGGIYALTPALRQGESLVVDLAPDTSADKMMAVLAAKPDKLRLSQWLKNTLRLPPAKIAFFHEMTAGKTPVRKKWVNEIKNLRVFHDGLRPMDEAISTAGGLRFSALNDDLMLTARPGVFCAGEMLDWDAPTGGYLLTACLATGRWAGQGALRYLAVAA
ncbi:MAG: TIGR03862 family flavoprotein [Roseobacter sp.]